MSRAIGMVEYKTVASGVKAADLIVKTAQVELLQSQTVCPGKYIILFAGELSAVRVCVDAAQKEYPESLIDHLSFTDSISNFNCCNTWSTDALTKKKFYFFNVFCTCCHWCRNIKWM